MGCGHLKRSKQTLEICMALVVLLSVFVPIPFKAFAAQSAVAVDSLPVRAKPSFLSKPLGRLVYGTKVNVVMSRGQWSRITRGELEGWVPKSSLGSRSSILRDLNRSAAESSETYKDEVATAGKGFSQEYESALREKDGSLNFAAVDRMETLEIRTIDLVNFQKSGRLQSDILK